MKLQDFFFFVSLFCVAAFFFMAGATFQRNFEHNSYLKAKCESMGGIPYGKTCFIHGEEVELK